VLLFFWVWFASLLPDNASLDHFDECFSGIKKLHSVICLQQKCSAKQVDHAMNYMNRTRTESSIAEIHVHTEISNLLKPWKQLLGTGHQK
jgi:uncharacterized protein with von Willebrand factor type A (vWA) domain